MAYSKENKEKIAYFKSHPEIVTQAYIIENKTTMQLAEEWGLPKSTVYELTRRAGVVGVKLAEKVNTCNESLFNSNNPIFCYIAGLISVDGYLDERNHRVCLRMYVMAKEILEKLREYFSISNVVAEYISDGYMDGYKAYDLTISSKVLMSELAKLSIHGRKKDLLVRFPNMALLNDECQEMYLRGVWDGDGTVRKSGSASIFEQSSLMIDAIAEFITSKLDIKTTRSDRYKDGNLVGYDLYVLTPWVMYEWMYKSNARFRIEKKYLRQF